MNYVLPFGSMGQKEASKKGDLVVVTGLTTCGKDLLALRVGISHNGVWRVVSVSCADRITSWTIGPMIWTIDNPLNPLMLELRDNLIVRPGEVVKIEAICEEPGWFGVLMVLTDDFPGDKGEA